MTSPTRTPGGAPIRPEIQWRYLQWRHKAHHQRGQVVHALRRNIFAPGLSRTAACGAMSKTGGTWHGGGTPIERGIASRLRPCRNCLRGLGLPEPARQ